MAERKAVDFAMDRLRRRLEAFEAAWETLPVSEKRMLVLRCDGLSLQEVAQHLGLSPTTGQVYAKRIMQTMRAAIGEGDVSPRIARSTASTASLAACAGACAFHDEISPLRD